MGAQAGQATTFNLVNYVGELFKVTPADTPFLSMIGGLSGGKSVNTKQFTWQTVDNNAAAATAALEGANPTYEERTRSQVTNVCQIFQYGVEVSYTKQAATGEIAGTSILGNQPVGDELSFQLALKLERAARDVEFSFLQGVYAQPADNLTARTTRGLKNAITTNAVAAGATALSKAHIDNVLRQMANSGAPFSQPVIFANAFNRQALSNIYGYAPADRNVGGVSISTIETDFARLGVVYDRHMPTDEVYVVDVAHCKPNFLAIPDKGHFFMEPLAKTGSAEKWQLYGEIGLEYGPEQWHGKITGTTTA